MGSSLTISDVSKSFGQTEVLSQISIDIAEGSFVSLLGPSGCGKSTLLRIVAGFEAQDRGAISIDAKAVDHLPPRARNLAMVFQNYALYPHMTVRENISLPLEMQLKSTLQRLPVMGRFTLGQGARAHEIATRALNIASIVEIDHLLDRRPSQLSGGQRQRVALARAMVRAPGLFLMDEPLSNLDAKLRVAMRSELVSLNKKLAATILYVTHDQTEAMTMSDRIALMMHGRVLQYDTPEALYGAPTHLDVATFVGQPAINCLPAEAKGSLQVAEAERVAFSVARDERGLVLAVRPEAFSLRPASTPDALLSIPVGLDRVEMMGSETLLWCSARRTGRTLVAQTRSSEYRAMVGGGSLDGELWLEASGTGLHIFDREGEVVPIVFSRQKRLAAVS